MKRKGKLSVKVFVVISLFLINVLFAQAETPVQTKTTKSNSVLIGIVQGTIIDSKNKQPLEYSNIVIFSAKDSSMINGTITDSRGKFMLDKIPVGKYYAKISFIGYENKIVNEIIISPDSYTKDLGTIELKGGSLELDAVEISGEKDTYISNLDKKVINVDKNITSTGGTAIDVLQNIPAVTIDINDNISLRGNSNVTILIDGKPSGLIGLSPGEVLSQMPANSIESIEVITNPSAKYDPEGTAGIINIITKKKGEDGINGLLSAMAGTGDKYNSSANFNYRVGALSFNATYEKRDGKFTGDGFTNRTSTFGGVTSYLNQTNESVFKRGGDNFTLGADYFADQFNSFSFIFSGRKFGFDFTNNTATSNFDAANILTRSFERDNEADRRFRGNEYSFKYNRRFDNKNQSLTADITYSKNRMDRDDWFVQSETSSTPLLQRSFGDYGYEQWQFKSDYTHPLSQSDKLEFGLDGKIKQLEMKNEYENFNATSNVWQLDLLSRNYFNYDEQIYSVYGMYTGSLWDLKVQTGFRLEQFLADGDLTLTSEKFENKYFTLYPTIHFAKDIAEGSEMMLSYSRRVNRPHHRQMNPFVNASDSLNIQQGNPKLKPEYINSFEFGYSKLFGPNSLTGSLFYKLTEDMISQISKLEAGGVTRTTSDNISEGTNYGLDLNVNYAVFKWWKLNANYTYFRNIIEGNSSGIIISSDDYSWNSKLISTFVFYKEFNAQVMANYQAPINMAQGKVDKTYSVDAALKHDFLNGDLSVNFRVSDIFDTMKFTGENFGEGFVSYSSNKRESRAVYLGFTYKLFNYKPDRSKERSRGEGESMDF